jgi:hypothetical protein
MYSSQIINGLEIIEEKSHPYSWALFKRVPVVRSRDLGQSMLLGDVPTVTRLHLVLA